MPRITIHEEDRTGAEYTGGETVVFVPGSIEIQEDSTKKSLADDNSCIYISTTNYNTLSRFLKIDNISEDIDLKTLTFIQTCLSHNMDVIYCYVEGFGGKELTDTSMIDQNTFEGDGKEEAIKSAKEKADGPIIKLPYILTWELDEGYYKPKYKGSKDALAFLQDKDTYNIKFLTTGCLNAINCTVEPDVILEDSNGTFSASFDFSIANALNELAFERKDCAALLSVDYDTSEVNNGNAFAKQLSDAINGTSNIKDSNSLTTTNNQESYGTIFFPNFVTSVSSGTTTKTVTMPSTLGYLARYGTCLGNGQEWLPIANSTRGSVVDMGTPDLTVTKYYMDTSIIKDENGSSFNGIVNLRPYGSVIWGDRTLLKLANTVKATAYLSLRMLVCDVSKRAYQAAIRNTYESNNDITWFNFKSRITDLLGEMVAAGVLSNYSVTKLPANSYNTIICRITLYPNLPVENFDIYINLENAEVTPADNDNV